jgi:hypothetical protein
MPVPAYSDGVTRVQNSLNNRIEEGRGANDVVIAHVEEPGIGVTIAVVLDNNDG